MVVVNVAADLKHALVSAILERGMQEGMTFTVPDSEFEFLRERYAVELRAFPSALQRRTDDAPLDWTLSLNGRNPQDIGPNGRRMVISTNNESVDLDASTIVAVQVHDMLPPLRDSHDASMFEAWAINEDTTAPSSRGPRYWCDRSDIAHGIVELLKGTPAPGVYNLAGRRAWSIEDTHAEFSPLLQRTSAGRSGEFSIEHLVATGIPTVKVVELDTTGQADKRPSLRNIHAFLEASTGEGWRPKTPLRQSLMFTIAMLESDHAS
ncbi:MAG: hypothetical protein VW982_05115 [Candidatus Poseidoniales archaeon]